MSTPESPFLSREARGLTQHSRRACTEGLDFLFSEIGTPLSHSLRTGPWVFGGGNISHPQRRSEKLLKLRIWGSLCSGDRPLCGLEQTFWFPPLLGKRTRIASFGWIGTLGRWDLPQEKKKVDLGRSPEILVF